MDVVHLLQGQSSVVHVLQGSIGLVCWGKSKAETHGFFTMVFTMKTMVFTIVFTIVRLKIVPSSNSMDFGCSFSMFHRHCQ